MVRRRRPSLPPHLAHLAPILAQRSRIEALAAALIDLLDSFDAPMEDREDEPDCCPAADDDPSQWAARQTRGGDLGAGSPEDAEISEPSDEVLARRWTRPASWKAPA